MYILLFFVLFFTFITLEAKVLDFKPSQKARYQLDYFIEGNPRLDSEAKSALDLEIQILDGTKYPFTVQVDIKRATYNGEETGEQGLSLEYLVSTPDQIDELAGETLSSGTEFCLQTFLGQLFQLSGGDLHHKRHYKLYSYYLLHDNDQPICAGENYVINERSFLTVKKSNEKVIEGVWEGYAHVRDGNYFEGRADAEGSIQWNVKNPLIQQRKNKLQLIEISRDYSTGIQTTTSIRIKQEWRSR